MDTFKMSFSEGYFRVGDIGKFSTLDRQYGMIINEEKQSYYTIYTIVLLKVSKWWVIRKIQLRILGQVLN
jgi:hypothetical protein